MKYLIDNPHISRERRRIKCQGYSALQFSALCAVSLRGVYRWYSEGRLLPTKKFAKCPHCGRRGGQGELRIRGFRKGRVPDLVKYQRPLVLEFLQGEVVAKSKENRT